MANNFYVVFKLHSHCWAFLTETAIPLSHMFRIGAGPRVIDARRAQRGPKARGPRLVLSLSNRVGANILLQWHPRHIHATAIIILHVHTHQTYSLVYRTDQSPSDNSSPCPNPYCNVVYCIQVLYITLSPSENTWSVRMPLRDSCPLGCQSSRHPSA